MGWLAMIIVAGADSTCDQCGDESLCFIVGFQGKTARCRSAWTACKPGVSW